MIQTAATARPCSLEVKSMRRSCAGYVSHNLAFNEWLYTLVFGEPSHALNLTGRFACTLYRIC